MKRRIRLSESGLYRIINESVKRVLNEVGESNTGQNLLGQLNMRKRLGRHSEEADEIGDYARKNWTDDYDDYKPDNYYDGQDKYRKYEKGRKIIKALKQLNFEKRGHEIRDYMHEYPSEIAVTNINVPAIADCREIARKFNVYFYTNEGFGLGIFEID